MRTARQTLPASVARKLGNLARIEKYRRRRSEGARLRAIAMQNHAETDENWAALRAKIDAEIAAKMAHLALEKRVLRALLAANLSPRAT